MTRRQTALHARPRLRTVAAVLAVCALAPATAAAETHENTPTFEVKAGTLTFSTNPAIPNFSAITLNGGSQTTTATMGNIGVDDATGSGAGWKVSVNGEGGAEKSAVFAVYCPETKCGTDSKGYPAGGEKLPANSLVLNSTSAKEEPQSGTTGTAPKLECASGCNVDSASAVKIISAAEKAGMGTWLAEAFTATSLKLTTPSTLKVPQEKEVFRVNIVWTLATGP
jgi:WxL domain surface cell wall-binding